MSIELIKNEINRFLKSEEPEVLCIKGKWGVGKTYTWQHCFKEASQKKSICLEKYSYVSLFGIGSLSELKYTIFSNAVPRSNSSGKADANSLKDRIYELRKIGKKSIPFLSGGLSFIKLGGLSAPLLNASFMLVRNQIVCFDDLERRSKGLEVIELLGLASLLKEERNCKVILLLNDQQLGDDQSIFENHLEKVVDSSFKFETTPEEALDLGLNGDDDISASLKPLLSNLNVTNIRVIRKIYRHSEQIRDLLSENEKTTIEQAIKTTALASWAVHQPNDAPKLDFIKFFNTKDMFMRAHKGELSEDETNWRELLSRYGYGHADELDHAIISGIEIGYFDQKKIAGYANLIENRRKLPGISNSFDAAWEQLYHGSLSVDDDEVLMAMYQAAMQEASAITVLNINSTVALLRENSHEKQAKELIDRYIEAHANEDFEFFELENNPFLSKTTVDEELKQAFAIARASYQDDRSPVDVIKDIAKKNSWKKADTVLLSKISVDQYIDIFETLEGEELRESVKSILRMGYQTGEYADNLKASATKAFQHIADKSPLRRRRLQSWGVPVTLPEESSP